MRTLRSRASTSRSLRSTRQSRNIEQTDKELRGYIDALQKSAGDLKTTIEEIDGKIKTLKEELSSSNAEILSKLESVKSDLEGDLTRSTKPSLP